MKLHKILPLLFAICLAACHKGTVDFSFSPAEPRAGETVIFSNLSTKGDKFAWQFGDNTVSTLKTPSHVYTRPGTYTIELMADSSRHKTCLKQITIFDSVPSMQVSTDSIVYMQEVTLSALVYNPFKKTVSYEWTLPQDAVIVNGNTSSEKLTVYFNKADISTTVQVVITFNGIPTEVKKELYIHRQPAQGLLIATAADNKFKQLVRQPLFDNGVAVTDEYVEFDEMNGKADRMLVVGDLLYLFCSNTDNALSTIELNQLILSPCLLGSQPTSGGFCFGSWLYWYNGSAMYRFSMPLTPRTTDADEIAGNKWSDIDAKYLSKKVCIATPQMLFAATTDSLYRLSLDNSGKVTECKSIYGSKEKQLGDFEVDAIGQRIYLIDNRTIVVCNLDGSNAKAYEQIEAETIALSLARGVFYVNRGREILELPLTYNPQNAILADPAYICTVDDDITAICFDPAER